MKSSTSNRHVVPHGSTYATCFGLALDKRYTGKPSDNKTFDFVRNRRCAWKHGRTVVAKPRPRGFYHDPQGRVLLKISEPMDVQTTNPYVGLGRCQDEEYKELASMLLSGKMEFPQLIDLKESPERQHLIGRMVKSVVSPTIAPQAEIRTTLTHSRAKTSRSVHHRTSSELRQSFKKSVQFCSNTLHTHTTSQKTTVSTPDTHGSPRPPPSPLPSGQCVVGDSKRSSQHWNDYFSPDGTVRRSLVVQDSANTLPSAAYTNFDYDYTTDFTLPKTIHVNGRAYCCRDSEYFLPANLAELSCQRSTEDLMQLQRELDSSLSIHSNDVTVPEDYCHGFGYLPLGISTPSAKPIEALDTPEPPDSPQSGFITIGIERDILEMAHHSHQSHRIVNPTLTSEFQQTQEQAPELLLPMVYQPHQRRAVTPTHDSLVDVDLSEGPKPAVRHDSEPIRVSQVLGRAWRGQTDASAARPRYAYRDAELDKAQTLLRTSIHSYLGSF